MKFLGRIAAVLTVVGALSSPAAQPQQTARGGSTPTALERDLTALQADLMQAKSGPSYEGIRNRAVQAKARAISLGRNDLSFAAGAIAMRASISQEKPAENQQQALPLMLQALGDAQAALDNIQSVSDRGLVEPSWCTPRRGTRGRGAENQGPH